MYPSVVANLHTVVLASSKVTQAVQLPTATIGGALTQIAFGNNPFVIVAAYAVCVVRAQLKLYRHAHNIRQSVQQLQRYYRDELPLATALLMQETAAKKGLRGSLLATAPSTFCQKYLKVERFIGQLGTLLDSGGRYVFALVEVACVANRNPWSRKFTVSSISPNIAEIIQELKQKETLEFIASNEERVDAFLQKCHLGIKTKDLLEAIKPPAEHDQPPPQAATRLVDHVKHAFHTTLGLVGIHLPSSGRQEEIRNDDSSNTCPPRQGTANPHGTRFYSAD